MSDRKRWLPNDHAKSLLETIFAADSFPTCACGLLRTQYCAALYSAKCLLVCMQILSADTVGTTTRH